MPRTAYVITAVRQTATDNHGNSNLTTISHIAQGAYRVISYVIGNVRKRSGGDIMWYDFMDSAILKYVAAKFISLPSVFRDVCCPLCAKTVEMAIGLFTYACGIVAAVTDIVE